MSQLTDLPPLVPRRVRPSLAQAGFRAASNAISRRNVIERGFNDTKQ